MIRHKLFRLLLALWVCSVYALTYATVPLAQNGTKSDYKSSVLLPLVGRQVKVALTSGKQIRGTLWDFGEDFISIKSKKGLLYSKTVKIAFPDFEYIEDPNGIKISTLELEAMDARMNPTQATVNAGNKSTLYFHTEDILGSNKEKSPSRETTGYQKTLLSLDTGKQPRKNSRVAANSKKKSTGIARSTAKRKPKKTARRKVATVSKRKSTRKPAVQTRLARNDNPKSKRIQKAAPEKIVAAVAAAQLRPGRASRLSVPAGKPLRSTRTKMLEYQNLILFGIVTLAFALLIMLKIKEAKGSAYGKDSLFPACIVKRNGKYGLIDQGTLDGIKLGDVMKLYRKEGKHVDFKGKAYIRKVADKFSIVETIPNGKFAILEIGDVGFLDRSFVSTGARGLRHGMGSIMGGLAKGLSRAAKNLDGKLQERAVNPTVIHEELVPTPATTQPLVVNPVNQSLTSRNKPQRVTTIVEPGDEAFRNTESTPNRVRTQPRRVTPKLQTATPRRQPRPQRVTTVDTPTQPERTMVGFGLDEL